MRKIVIIDKEEELKKLAAYLMNGRFSELALDFEAESFLHMYGVHLCLIQLFDGDRCYIIDPIKIKNISHIKPVFESNIAKIIYHANGDLLLLDQLYNYQIKNIFDISIAAHVLKFKPLSLPSLLSTQLGVSITKSKRKQKANWMRRPLRKGLIEYAADDVNYLIPLKAKLVKLLEDKNLLEVVEQKNSELESIRYQPKIDPHLNVKKAKQLNENEQIYLKSFYKARDWIARKLNYPPNNVVKNSDLISIAQKPPKNANEWMSIIGNPKPRIARYIHLLRDAKKKSDSLINSQPK